MKKQEFMNQLESLLQDIPEQERTEAIQYYNDYFEDAGEENEQEVVEALGSPYKVAENIKRDLYQNRNTYEYEQDKVAAGKEVVKYQPQMERMEYTPVDTKKSGLSVRIIVLIVILCVLASPILFVLLLLLLSILITAAIMWMGVVISIGVSAVSFLVAGAISVVVGIGGIFLHPMAGIGVVGAGLLLAAFGLLAVMLEVFIVGKLTPAVFRGIRWILRKLTGKKKA